MIINGERSLAHVEKVSWVKKIEDDDNIDLVGVLGWVCIAEKNEFEKGDFCIFIEIDSKLPQKEWSEFLRSENFKIKTMKLPKPNVISQGIALPIDAFNVEIPKKVGFDVTEILEIIYSKPENILVESTEEVDEEFNGQNEIYQSDIGKSLMKSGFGESMMYSIFGKPKDTSRKLPEKFSNIPKPDTEYFENIPEILYDKTPFIRTQKCDGFQATYVLEKIESTFARASYEFYIYSRNNRIFGDENDTNSFFWEMAEKYDIEYKLKDYLKENKNCKYVCWQGEICGPQIKNNPHKLDKNHLFCFNMTDSENGVFDIREAKRYWDMYSMESVPIEKMTYILPDTVKEFKQTADGFYDSNICEGHTDCAREGWIYYKTTNPNFRFKNISIKYLLE